LAEDLMNDPSDDPTKRPRIEPLIRFEHEERGVGGYIGGGRGGIVAESGRIILPGHEISGVITEPSGLKKSIVIDPADLIAIGIVILAIGAVVVAIIFSIAVAMGRVSVKDASTVILGCVGGAAISGVVAALLGKKSKDGS
jgi:hypothetical protein